MKKKGARKLVPGDQLVMVRDGSYSACFEAGDAVSFVGLREAPMLSVAGLYEGREITQTISRKDVELYTERPHEGLRKTYKAGQEWEFKTRMSQHWIPVHSGHTPREPTWYAGYEYRLKPEPPKQTRREQLIAAGVPAEELARVVGWGLDVDASFRAARTISYAFTWHDTPQGHAYWEAWEDRLKGKDVTIPEPLDAAPELYCVVFGADNQLCWLSPDRGDTTGTLEQCNSIAASMGENFPDNNYRVMRLVPVGVE